VSLTGDTTEMPGPTPHSAYGGGGRFALPLAFPPALPPPHLPPSPKWLSVE
jgi:hypothetical protein